MVGRLVEHEDVVLAEDDLAEQEARGLAARQGLGGLERSLSAEEEAPQDRADLLFRPPRVEAVEPVVGRRALARVAERLVVVLREVADARVVTPADLAPVGRKDVALRLLVEALVGADDHLQQRGLADAAPAEDRDAVAAVDVERRPVDDDLLVERLAHALEAEHVAAARLLHVEAHVRPYEARALGPLGLDDFLELLDLLHAALGLLALGRVGAEALHELLELAHLLLGALRDGLGALLVLVLRAD